MTQIELENGIAKRDKKIINAQNLVMIQCVGCRNEDRNYCSRICCSESVKNALALKKINPKMNIYVLYRDIRTYGFNEDYYRKARGKAVRFIRYLPDDKPVVEEIDKDCLTVTVTDQTLKKKIAIDADILSLAAAVIPSESTKEIAGLFKVTLSPDGYFKEAHVKLRPVDFATDGVYLCGMAHYPKLIQETINQAYGAAGRVLTLLSHEIITASGSVCVINEKRCTGCGACADVCNYGALNLKDTRQGKKATINPILCKGDGLCNSICPTGAISLKHFTDAEIISQIDALANEKQTEVKQNSVA